MGFRTKPCLIQYTQPTSAVSSITVTLDTHASGDVIVLVLSQDGATGTNIAPDATATTAGWTMIGTQNASGGVKMAIAYLICDSSAEANPTFTGVADEWIVHQYVLDDLDTAALLDATHSWQRTDWNNVYTQATSTVSGSSNAGAAITPPAGSLLLVAACSDGAGNFIRFKTDEVFGTGLTFNHISDNTSASITAISGFRQIDGSETIPTLTLYSGLNTEGGNIFCVAFKNASGGKREKDCRTGVDEIAWHGSFASTLGAATFVDGIDDITSAPLASINSINCSASNPTVSQTKNQALTSWGKMTGLTNADTTAVWSGGTRILAAAKNMENKVFGVQWEIDAGSATATRFETEGCIVVFSDGTNWVAYQLRPKAYVTANAPYSAVIALGKATAYASSGAITWSAVTRIGYAFHRSGAGSAQMSVKNEVLMPGTAVTAQGTGIPSLTGGGTGRGVSFPTLVEALSGFGHYDLARLQGTTQVQPKCSLRIGDGATTTVFDSSAGSMEFPAARNFASQPDHNATANSLQLTIKADAGDSIALAAGAIVTTVEQGFVIDAATSATDIYSFVGESVVGFLPSDNSGLAWSGVVFKNCGTLTIAAGGDLTNCTIAKTTSTHAPLTITANGTTVTTSTITVADTSITTAHHISFGASVTSCTLNGVTLSGAAGTDKIYSALASGTLTITTDGTGTALAASDVTFVGGSTATAVIAAPQVYQSVVVSGFTAGSRIQIYDTTSSTELFNGTASAGNTVVSGTTATWTDPVAASANRAIRIRVSYVSGVTAKNFIETSGLTCGQTSGTAEITYPVSPTDDTTYNANGENGATIYGGGEITFVDASPDRVDMNMTAATLSLQKQYAAWVYYAFTATGIATDIDYINAIDTANYEFTNIRWKNTATAPATLTITGGYAWDSSTGLAITLVDTTGGTIFLMPDHVVAYATGSGVTAQDVADIAAASATSTLSAAQTTPIHADIRKVLGGAIDGTGSDADPWGPV